MLIKNLNQKQDEMSEINLTPFIDIMLVLLIIFMIVTPLVTSSVKVELPKGASNEVDEKKPIILFISQDEFSINQEKINLDQINLKLDELTNNNKEQVIYFHIDKSVNYERIVNVMNEVKKAKYEKLAFSTEVDNK